MEPKREKQFYPDYLAEIIFCALVGFELLLDRSHGMADVAWQGYRLYRQFQPRFGVVLPLAL